MRPALATLALAALAALAACRDEPASSTRTTSHVVLADPTAGDQSNDPRDLALAGEVRRSLMTDRKLSTRAKSVVVIVRDGVVTLRGDVAGPADHDALVARVVSVPGVVRIDDRTRRAAEPTGEGR